METQDILIKDAIQQQMNKDRNFDHIVRQTAIIYQKMIKPNDDRDLADELLEIAENGITMIIYHIFGTDLTEELESHAVDIIYDILHNERRWGLFPFTKS